MSVLATINGIDVALLVSGAAGWLMFVMERQHTRALRDRQPDFSEAAEQALSNVRTICGAHSHYEFVTAYTGRGQRIKESRERLNPPATQQTCVLVHGHEGPHMGSTDLWS